MDSIRLSSLYDFKFPHNRVYPTMALKKYSNSWCRDKWNMDLQVKNLKLDISTTPWQTSLFPVPIITPRQRQITRSLQLRWRTMKTYFKMYWFKSIFLKPVTEECTFC